MTELILEYLICALLLFGGTFTLAGAIGLVSLPDFYTRLHAPTKATTVGVGSIVLSSSFYSLFDGLGFGTKELLIVMFLFITAPISANMLAKAAMHLNVGTTEKTRGKTWEQ